MVTNGSGTVPENPLVYNPPGLLKAAVDISRYKVKSGYFYILMQYKITHSALREVYFQ